MKFEVNSRDISKSVYLISNFRGKQSANARLPSYLFTANQ